MALADLDQKYDFKADDAMVRDKDTVTFAEDARGSRRAVAPTSEVRLAQGDRGQGQGDKENVSMDKAIEKLRKRYNSIRKSWHQTDNDELLERYLTSMTTGFDPHSDYMSPSSLDNFNITMRLELDGIGASLRGEDGYTVVHNIIPGGAADKDARLKPEDKIVGVGQGTDGPIEDIVDMKLNDVVEKIRGKRKTVVRLEVQPADGSPNKIYAITRDRIELKDSEARSEIIEWGKKADGTPYHVGVIQLPSFYMDMDGARLGTAGLQEHDARRAPAARGFQPKNVDAVVIDLRWNGGGSLTEAVNMTGLFIDHRTGRASERLRRPNATLPRPGAGHGLEGPAGRDDQQV